MERDLSRIEIKNSAIEGRGVFAAQDIGKEDTIFELDDTHVVDDINILTPYEQIYEADWIGDGKTIHMQAPEKHVNHSCEPNMYLKTINSARNAIAMRDIKKGEEITGDYAIGGYYDSDIPCHCGSKRCRGTISPNFFKLPRERQLEYLPYLDAWFLEKFRNELKNLV